MKKKYRHAVRIGFIVFVSFIFLWALKAPLFSSFLSQKMKIHVSIAGIKIRPTYSKIYRFHIRNPTNARGRTAFSAKNIIIDYQFKELRTEPVTIDKIEVNDAFMSIEFYNAFGTKNNWTELLAKMGAKKKSTTDVEIRKLVINNLEVEIRGMGLAGVFGSPIEKKTIKRLEFDNINSKDGFPTEQLIQAIFGKTGLMKYIDQIYKAPGLIKDFLNPFTRTRDSGCEELFMEIGYI